MSPLNTLFALVQNFRDESSVQFSRNMESNSPSQVSLKQTFVFLRVLPLVYTIPTSFGIVVLFYVSTCMQHRSIIDAHRCCIEGSAHLN